MHKIRDLGSLIFVDIRDRHGLTQVVARENDDVLDVIKSLRPEYVVCVRGEVERRSAETLNTKIETGEVEVAAAEVQILNTALTPPFQIDEETPVSEEVRLRYRYLDLRRQRMRDNIGLRHRVCLAARTSLDREGFWEIETPMLTKSTPEGARDYLVSESCACRQVLRTTAVAADLQTDSDDLRDGSVLPDRFAVFRDEDLRADRQPEFTQIDVEMSFATPDLVFRGS